MAVEKLKIDYKTQNETWTNPKIKNHENSHDLRLIRPQKRCRNPEHMYLNP